MMRLTTAMGNSFGSIAAKVAKGAMALVLASGMAFAVGAQALAPEEAFAANKSFNSPAKNPYTYTVRVFSGEQGTFVDGTDCAVFPKVTAGDTMPFNPGSVTLKSDKHYVKGWKFAGKDDVTKNKQNNDTLTLSSVVVDSDMDLVVCYGVLVNSVGYTIQYVDQNGNELLPSEHFYGNIGDNPVLAYRYIEGFLPQAYNLTGELYANEAENVYTFRYTPVALPEDITITLPTVVTETVAAPAAAAPEAAAPEAAPAAPVTPEDAPAVAVPTPPAEELIDDNATPLAAPADVEDIRDDETPKASLNSLAKGPTIGDEGGMVGPSPLVIGLGIGAIVLIGVAVAFFLIYRKNQRQMVVNAARASIASGYAATAADDDYTQPAPNYVPLTNQQAYGAQQAYPDMQQAQYPQQTADAQQYNAQYYDAQQYSAQGGMSDYGSAQYGAQSYDPTYGGVQGDPTYGGQAYGQYDPNGQYNQGYGNPNGQ